jgi:hypothetical protein
MPCLFSHGIELSKNNSSYAERLLHCIRNDEKGNDLTRKRKIGVIANLQVKQSCLFPRVISNAVKQSFSSNVIRMLRVNPREEKIDVIGCF